MMNDTLSQEQVAWIIDEVLTVAKEAAHEARDNRNDEFANGRALGLYEAIDIIKNRLIMCNIEDLSPYNLDIDLDKELS